MKFMSISGQKDLMTETGPQGTLLQTERSKWPVMAFLAITSLQFSSKKLKNGNKTKYFPQKLQFHWLIGVFEPFQQLKITQTAF